MMQLGNKNRPSMVLDPDSRFAQRSQQREQLELLLFLAFSLASCYTLARTLLANELLVNSAPSP